MKLTDLKPKWIVFEGRVGMGVTFDCPCPRCSAAVDPCVPRRLYAHFTPTLDGGPPEQDLLVWQRTGGTFETLTLTPSIDASRDGHWHGFITNGEIT